MRSPTHILLPLLALTTTSSSHIGAAAQQQEQHPPIRCAPPSNGAAAAAAVPDSWPGYAFTLRYGLNYEFVAAQAAAAAQLCQAGGSVVDHATGSSGAQTWGIEAAAPEVADALGYVAGVLVVRAPAGLLAELGEQVGNATSRLYGNPDALARQVAEQIDDAFDVVLREDL
ncbi:uncharacterized protein B0H64DRAFT_443619 [Chaetomium fimeti]|uniref:Uncharacterized protein n=1 Tax=Chaetomium fimeti TaxID=1854472 RepID=A0AAE0HDF4_9PEZI|nr:hypothetical protein B0H64DRAFT_443619 [Chaetomium fimeti]